MSRYTIRMNYNASIIVEVEAGADEEGVALEKARMLAEDADIREFSICGEREAEILQKE